MPVIRPMTPDEYAAWKQSSIPAYAQEKVVSGAWRADEALQKATQEFDSMLPDGLDTPDHHVNAVLADDGAAVGVLWFAVKERGSTRIAYVYEIAIAPAHRRQGHAQRALRALEGEVRRLGLQGIALHVFGHNTAARALYAQLGYEPTNLNLFKAVPTDA